ncbi:extracellular matrix regulator RemB [Bacillus xiapuensis]|uniref:extracellular matrix regulator RemB n=1 Tax=Bacillus xiapuensis TaxID=2014075 RepID=UPI000C236EA7|nr:DUF370 domain-containing protein [Bacillus xiapuensis]
MYVYIGESIMLLAADIVAIMAKGRIDLSSDQAARSVHASSVALLESGGYKSVVVTENTLYLSPFSSSTLKKRIDDHYF